MTSGQSQEMKLISVTPEMAAQWREKGGGRNFRRLDQERADILARNIQRLGWKLDGNSFKFDREGRLVDGQHRAYAIEKLRITVQAWATYGVDDDVTIDTGQTRTLNQLLRAAGEAYSDTIGAALQYVAAFEAGRLEMARRHRREYANGELLSLLHRHHGLRISAAKASSATQGGIGISRGQLAAIHYLATRSGLGDHADAFLDDLGKGYGLKEHDPVFCLRERMIAVKVSRRPLPEIDRLAILIKAWNLRLEGRSARVMRWRAATDEFPELLLDPSLAREEAPGEGSSKEGQAEESNGHSHKHELSNAPIVGNRLDGAKRTRV